MKDLIAKLQLDANCALGAIWMHIDAQATRIAELEAQLAALPPDTDKLREAIFMAGIPTMAINGMNAFNSWESECWARGALAMRVAVLELMNDVAGQAPVREVPGWQPIETAPKDGTRIMIFMGAPWARIVTVRWFDLWGNWQEGDFPEVYEEYCGIGSAVPTHWMPLPSPPKVNE